MLPVHWIMLDLSPETIFKRISRREEMGIYESKKCVEYFSSVYLELAVFYGMTIVDVSSGP
jgi:thymidylate kinase